MVCKGRSGNLKAMTFMFLSGDQNALGAKVVGK